MIELLLMIGLTVWLSWAKNLIQRHLQGLTLLLTGSKQLGIWIYTLFFLPGILLHEMSHFLTAIFLGVRTGSIRLFPHSSETKEAVALGSVQIAKTDFLRSSLIGAAPFLIGSIFLYVWVDMFWGKIFSGSLSLSMHQVFNWVAQTDWWQVTGFIYAIFMVGNTMFSSKEDQRSYPILAVFAVLFGGILFASGQILLFVDKVYPFVLGVARSLAFAFALTSTLQLGVVGLLLLVEKISSRLLKKRIVYH